MVNLAPYSTAIAHRGLIVGVTWFGTRWLVSPAAHWLFDRRGLRWMRAHRKRYLGRATLPGVRRSTLPPDETPRALGK